MDLFDTIYGRRSIRKFTDRPVSEADILKIVDAANWAPSACNAQGWRFILVDDRGIKDRLAKMGVAYFLGEAPQSILVLYDNRTDNVEYEDHIQSAAAAIQNMLLAAHSLGIGTCWICHLPGKNELRKLFQIPDTYDPIALIALGYSEETPRPVDRKHVAGEVLAHNRFSFDEGRGATPMKLRLKRLARRLYYRLPVPVRTMVDRPAKKFERRFDE